MTHIHFHYAHNSYFVHAFTRTAFTARGSDVQSLAREKYFVVFRVQRAHHLETHSSLNNTNYTLHKILYSHIRMSRPYKCNVQDLNECEYDLLLCLAFYFSLLPIKIQNAIKTWMHFKMNLVNIGVLMICVFIRFCFHFPLSVENVRIIFYWTWFNDENGLWAKRETK